MRATTLMLLLATLLPVAMASDAPATPDAGDPKVAGKRKGPDRAEPARPFIERSLVLAPERVGDLALVAMQDYPGNPAAGVGIRYQHPDFMGVRLDLFVYPAGRVDQGALLEQGMAGVTSEIEGQAAKGRYADLAFDEIRDFDLRQVASDGSLVPEGEGEATASEPWIPGFLLEYAGAADADTGRLMDVRLSIDGRPHHSRAFLFYRGLYLYKGRITTSIREMPGENFERFSQHAMAQLVPAIEVRNTGGCSDQVIHVDPDASSDESQAAFQRAVVEASIQAANENCRATLDETVPEGMRAVPLAFDPAMWRN